MPLGKCLTIRAAWTTKLGSDEDDQKEDDKMADEAKKTRRKSTGPRQQRPVFAIVTYTDDSGAPVQLDKSRLNIKIERDSAAIVELLTGGDSAMAGAAVCRVELPQPQKRNTANAEAGASA